MVEFWDCGLVVQGMPGRGTTPARSSQAIYIYDIKASLFLVARFVLELIRSSLASIFNRRLHAHLDEPNAENEVVQKKKTVHIGAASLSSSWRWVDSERLYADPRHCRSE
jgi:hypothetical protein